MSAWHIFGTYEVFIEETNYVYMVNFISFFKNLLRKKCTWKHVVMEQDKKRFQEGGNDWHHQKAQRGQIR